MSGIEFLSKGTYVVLPSKSRPKVFLAIDNALLAENAFKLYNPFSSKAKGLKGIVKWLCLHCNSLAKLSLFTIKAHNSDFMMHLKEVLGLSNCVSSVYYATDMDKVVLQLQSKGSIIGYLKFPLNPIGVKHIETEIKAIDRLSQKGFVNAAKYVGTYKKQPYVILEPLEGAIKTPEMTSQIFQLLDCFKSSYKFQLKHHPRVLHLKKELVSIGLKEFVPKLNALEQASKLNYAVVIEHGDFAPWNLIETSSGVVPFDFEYFEEKGLEYLDLIKYHFQVERLLKAKKGKRLINSVAEKVRLNEFSTLFSIFLINEIKIKKEMDQDYTSESALIDLL